MLDRRRLLKLGGITAGTVAGGVLLLPPAPQAATSDTATGHGGHGQHGGRRPAAVAGSASPNPLFSQRMPVPRELSPTRRGGVDAYRIPIQEVQYEFQSGSPTAVRTFGGQFVGPTIRAKTGRPVEVTYTNQLAVPANVHLHGGHVSHDSDGYPMDLIDPGQSRTYQYPNAQQGATLWYHDHSHGTEAENVYKGLHGFYILEDDAEDGLGLPSGDYDVPIMLRDAQIDANGALVWPSITPDRTTILANGVVNPYFQVAARKYRFRILNAANERMFRLTLGGAPITQIGSDGGLLPAPVPRSEILLGSAERVDIVVDFTGLPVGTHLVLYDVTGPVLRFDVTRNAADNSQVPATLRPLPALGTATVVRDVALMFDESGNNGLVNGQVFDPNRVDFQVKRGATEIWRISNTDTYWGAPHTFHLHLEQFQVLDRDGAAPSLDDAGRKDTVFVAPGETVRIQVTFTDFLGKYVYHCHFLDHSAVGMMAQLEIVP